MTIATSAIVVRNRTEADILSDELMDVGMRMFAIDYYWQWVAEYNGEIVGQILAAPMHGVLVLLRITASSKAPKNWTVLALRRVLSDAHQRGLSAYVTLLEDRKTNENRLARIAVKAGAVLMPFSGSIAIGPTEIKY